MLDIEGREEEGAEEFVAEVEGPVGTGLEEDGAEDEEDSVSILTPLPRPPGTTDRLPLVGVLIALRLLFMGPPLTKGVAWADCPLLLSFPVVVLV